MYVVGIDENGLGPLLGPLVVTASVFETRTYDQKAFFETARKHLPADDSKKVFSKSKMVAAEVKTLSWLKSFGVRASTHRELMNQICAKYPLARTCTPDVPDYCQPSDIALPYNGDRDQRIEIVCARSRLEEDDIKPVAVRTVSVCPGSFNLSVADPLTNKFSLDFCLMMHLVTELRDELGCDLEVYCGKVGSTRKYGDWFRKAGLDAWWVEQELPEISTYLVNKVGKISFVRDGDASHLPIAVASMVGKYVRELAMHDLNAFLATPGVRDTSGYHNKVTADFVTKTDKTRRDLGLCDGCFKRDS